MNFRLLFPCSPSLVRGTNLTGCQVDHGDSAVLGDHGHGSSHGHGGGGHGSAHHGHDAVAHVTHAPPNDSHHDHDSHEVDEVSKFSIRTIVINCTGIRMTIKKNKWSWVSYIMCRTLNRWGTK